MHGRQDHKTPPSERGSSVSQLYGHSFVTLFASYAYVIDIHLYVQNVFSCVTFFFNYWLN